jgi:hypothetical protein
MTVKGNLRGLGCLGEREICSVSPYLESSLRCFNLPRDPSISNGKAYQDCRVKSHFQALLVDLVGSRYCYWRGALTALLGAAAGRGRAEGAIRAASGGAGSGEAAVRQVGTQLWGRGTSVML